MLKNVNAVHIEQYRQQKTNHKHGNLSPALEPATDTVRHRIEMRFDPDLELFQITSSFIEHRPQ